MNVQRGGGACAGMTGAVLVLVGGEVLGLDLHARHFFAVTEGKSMRRAAPPQR